MSTANIVFPHQLFEQTPLPLHGASFYLLEEFLFFRQYNFHQQKIAFHRASMSAYADYLRSEGLKVHYIEAHDTKSDIRVLIKDLANQGITNIHYIDPADNWLESRIVNAAAEVGVRILPYRSPLFLNSKEDLEDFFSPEKTNYSQANFYKQQRQKRKLLLDVKGEPIGGKWSFDSENRKKYPREKEVPRVSHPDLSRWHQDAMVYVEQRFPHNIGSLSNYPLYPVDFKQARKWLQDFLENRFDEFGDYEDAIVADEQVLHHSVLTPMLNVGLLLPNEIIDKTITFAADHDIPLNALEGFIRQIIGWREFVKGIYQYHGSVQRTRNFWNFSRPLPDSFYDGTTGIYPVDQTIKKVLQTGYCHHIERLMVLGNFMLLCEFDPDDVYRWFMEMFIDAYDWVMVPNVYGMSQYADGGLFATKPYISGSNYLMKMSNYEKGSWQKIWDGLFWRFIDCQRPLFLGNARMRMMVSLYDKMSKERKEGHLHAANDFLASL